MATEDEVGVLDRFRAFLALEPDVLVLSLAMFAFSLGFQMTSRFLPPSSSAELVTFSPSVGSSKPTPDSIHWTRIAHHVCR
jgi:hypothetical protein